MRLTSTLAFIAFVALSACTTVIARAPVSEDRIDKAAPYGIPGLTRVWGDGISPEQARQIILGQAQRLRDTRGDELASGRSLSQISLALSGGGPDGAYGAGLLKGWTESGNRPDFHLVTGISTGAIIALFAFLGSDYDDELEEIYTTYTTDQLLVRAIGAALLGGTALTDARGYRKLIEDYIDDDVVAKLAAGSAEGRALLIGTTNLDAARPVVWSVSAIAATGHPSAKRLIHDIIQASSAIPAAFPPVLVPVIAEDGRRYDEMHVDGGATQQVMLFSPQAPLKAVDAELGVKIDRTLYVVVNNKLRKPYDPVRPRVLAIGARAASSLLGGAGTGDIYKIYAIANRDDIDLNVISIPRDFALEPEEAFDPVYMGALFKLGYEDGVSGEKWSKTPPDFAPWPPE